MAYLYIHNAHIATSTEVFPGSVLVEDEKIARVVRYGEDFTPPAGTRHIDAEEKFLLPGGVDPHTHFDLDAGFTRASDNFLTGSIAAACGGTTTVIDHMAFGPKGCPLTHQPQVYHKLAMDAVIDYGFHGTIQHLDDEVLADMQTLRDGEGISSFKIYLTYDFRLGDEEALRVLQRAKELGIVVCVHCENHAVITALREQFTGQGKTAPRFHPLSRPAEAEAEAVHRMLALAKAAGEAHLYIVHLSTRLGMQAIHAARAEGQRNIFAETCPQYLLLDDGLYNDDAEGLKYIMSPPLRKPSDQKALWQGLHHNEIDTVGTDHCPFFFETQKQRGAQNFTLCPNGAPGVELRMPLLFSEGYAKNRLTLPQVVRSCCTAPAEVFGIAPQKGDIREGADADLVLFDPDIEWTVAHSELHERVDYTPYEGMRLKGRPVLTFARGEEIYAGGEFCGQTGRGRYLKRGHR